jgi:hypothetical protein
MTRKLNCLQPATCSWKARLTRTRCATTGSVLTAAWRRCSLPAWRSSAWASDGRTRALRPAAYTGWVVLLLHKCLCETGWLVRSGLRRVTVQKWAAQGECSEVDCAGWVFRSGLRRVSVQKWAAQGECSEVGCAGWVFRSGLRRVTVQKWDAQTSSCNFIFFTLDADITKSKYITCNKAHKETARSTNLHRGGTQLLALVTVTYVSVYVGATVQLLLLVVSCKTC